MHQLIVALQKYGKTVKDHKCAAGHDLCEWDCMRIEKSRMEWVQVTAQCGGLLNILGRHDNRTHRAGPSFSRCSAADLWFSSSRARTLPGPISTISGSGWCSRWSMQPVQFTGSII